MRSLLHYTLLSMVMVASMIQPIDITTHCACKKLNTALQQAVPLDHFKSILKQISYHESITQQDYTDIIIQAQHSAQESKKVVETTLTDTQNKPNQSDTLQAAAALLASSYLISSFIAICFFKVSFAHNEAQYFFPLQRFIQWKFNATNPALGLVFVQLFAALTLAPYGLYWSIEKISKKWRALALLHEKSTNLDAIIAYLQELQTEKAASR